eukprot:4407696-Pyramimonas_sp.AAC.2
MSVCLPAYVMHPRTTHNHNRNHHLRLTLLLPGTPSMLQHTPARVPLLSLSPDFGNTGARVRESAGRAYARQDGRARVCKCWRKTVGAFGKTTGARASRGAAKRQR